MSLVDVLVRSDTDTVFPLAVGAVVTHNKGKLVSPPLDNVPDSRETHFGFGIVVSVSPLVVVSEKANMRWSTLVAADLTVIGKTSQEVLNHCNTRLAA